MRGAGDMMKTARGGSAAGRQAVGAVVGPPRTHTHPLGAPAKPAEGDSPNVGTQRRAPAVHTQGPDAPGHAGNQQTRACTPPEGLRGPLWGRRARRSLQLLPVVGQVASALPSDANQLPGRPEAPA